MSIRLERRGSVDRRWRRAAEISPEADKGLITFGKSRVDREGLRRRCFGTAEVVVVVERMIALDASASAIVD